MKISEVLRRTKSTTYNILKYPELLALDQAIDKIFELTNNLTNPVEWFNEELGSEYKEYFIAAEKKTSVIFPNGSTISTKIRSIINYLSTPRNY
jgi:hypothetical protein